MHKMQVLTNNIKNNSEAIIVLLSTFFVFYYIFIKALLPETCIDYISDIPLHADEIIKSEGQNIFHGNFVVYFLTILLSGFTFDKVIIGRSLCVLLSMAECATYLIFKKQFIKMGKSRRYSELLAASMLSVFAIPYLYFLNILGCINGSFSANMYLTNYVPTVWHNSTIIFSMPFSLALFLLSEKVLQNFNNITIIQMCIIVAIDVLIKPSFFFIFLVSFPIVSFIRYRFSKEYLLCLLPVLTGAVCMAYVFISIYCTDTDGSSVVIDFGRLLQLDIYGWYKIIASIAFPTLFLVFYCKTIGKDISFLYVLLLLSSAIGISLVCYEIGPREGHGNMTWQTVPALQISYFFILRTLINQRPKNIFEQYVKKTFAVLFSFHVMSGIWYLSRYLFTGNYM